MVVANQPTLRDVARTAPYMHDGSLATLEDVIEFYDRGGNVNLYLDEELRPLHLTKDEKAALMVFLQALSGAVQEGSTEQCAVKPFSQSALPSLKRLPGKIFLLEGHFIHTLAEPLFRPRLQMVGFFSRDSFTPLADLGSPSTNP